MYVYHFMILQNVLYGSTVHIGPFVPSSKHGFRLATCGPGSIPVKFYHYKLCLHILATELTFILSCRLKNARIQSSTSATEVWFSLLVLYLIRIILPYLCNWSEYETYIHISRYYTRIYPYGRSRVIGDLAE
jgi:hypothetical protein